MTNKAHFLSDRRFLRLYSYRKYKFKELTEDLINKNLSGIDKRVFIFCKTGDCLKSHNSNRRKSTLG